MSRHRMVETGLALAHVVRVNLRIALAAVVLLAPSVSGAQVAAEQPAAGAPGTEAMFVPGRDTLVVRTVDPDPAWWETVTSVASGLLTIAIIVLAVALVPAAWNFRKNHQLIKKNLEKVQGDIAPLVRHANSIADDVNYITTSIRADVQQVNQTVAAANRQLLEAVKKAEKRVDEMNALLAVAQEEAESAFISTAAALRGISTGAAALAGMEPGGRPRPRRARRRRGERDLQESLAELREAIDEDLEEAVEDVGPALDDSFDEEEVDNGDDYGRDAADSGRAAPRTGRQRPGHGHGPGEGGTV
jgi:uncharacterized protein YoxC